MTFAFPWALWGLLAIPLLIAIYFFRRRFRPRTVSALFLWQAPRIRTGGGRKVSRLESSILLILEIIMAALLAMAAAGPGCRAQINIHNATFILDDSASMAAKSSGDKSPKEKASEKITEYLNAHRPFSCNIILTGFQPKLLAGTIDNIKDVKESLKKWKPQKPLHGYLGAFRLARQISGKDGKIIFCTDHAPPENKDGKPEAPEDVEWLAFGIPLDNAAITAASRNQKTVEGKEEIFLIVRNFGKKEKNIIVKCSLNNKEKTKIAEKKLKLAPGSYEKISFEIKNIVKGAILVEIESEKDCLNIDNNAILAPESNVRARIMTDIKDKTLNRTIKAALSALGKEILMTTKRPHIIISDNEQTLKSLSEKHPEAWTAQFSPAASNKKDIRINIGPFVIAKHDKICKEVYLKGTRWASSKDAFSIKGLLPLISCQGAFLLSEKPQLHENSPRHFYFSFVPLHSNIQKTPAWPILIHNLIEARLDSLPGFNKKNFRAGEQAKGNFFKSKEIKLIPSGGSPEGSKIFNGGNFVFSSSVPALFKTVSDGKVDDDIVFNFLSPEESDLSGCCAGIWSGSKKSKGILKAAWRDEAWIFLLIALGLGVLHAFFTRKLEARL